MLITDPIEIAAAYLFYICGNHPFVDGNKPTALACCLTFLSENKLLSDEKLPLEKWENLVLDVAARRIDRGETTARLRNWFAPRDRDGSANKRWFDSPKAGKIANMHSCIRLFALSISLGVVASLRAAEYPAPAEGDYTIRDFKFTSGETMPELRLHYRTLGKSEKDGQGNATNAVLIMHGTTGSGAQFIRPEFAGELFGKDRPLDATKFFVVLPDGIGHGKSSKPSDGMHAKFPRYGYTDMVEAQYRLLTEGLGVNHARLVMGTSMGGMHTWLWGESHPDFMDALMPLASLPWQVSGRNRAWRRIIIDAIRNDPDWRGGDYKAQPPSLRTAAEMLWFMSSNPVLRQKEAPTLAKTDEALDKFVEQIVKADDANDVLYAVEASHDYDPGPNLEKIRAPLLAINSADDLINPPELGILESEIKRIPRGRSIVMPLSDKTRGHGSHTIASLWKDQLMELLKETEQSH
jgi:homoserine O-acetyltransferase/O-succinyltransferase